MHQFKNVDTYDFIGIVEEESGINLSDFVNTWLVEYKLPEDEMLQSLKRNEVIAALIRIKNGKSTVLDEDMDPIIQAEVIRKMVQDTTVKLTKDFYKQAFSLKDLKVRQTIAQSIQRVPEGFKTTYETLLKDESYLTMEYVLFNLWINFPEDRKRYLEQTSSIIGFNDKNVRILWLTLALNTEGFDSNKYHLYYQELVNYTKPKYHFEVRQNAFTYLKEMNAFNKVAIDNLKEGRKHHNWRFRSFCRRTLEELEKREENKPK